MDEEFELFDCGIEEMPEEIQDSMFNELYENVVDDVKLVDTLTESVSSYVEDTVLVRTAEPVGIPIGELASTGEYVCVDTGKLVDMVMYLGALGVDGGCKNDADGTTHISLGGAQVLDALVYMVVAYYLGADDMREINDSVSSINKALEMYKSVPKKYRLPRMTYYNRFREFSDSLESDDFAVESENK